MSSVLLFGGRGAVKLHIMVETCGQAACKMEAKKTRTMPQFLKHSFLETSQSSAISLSYQNQDQALAHVLSRDMPHPPTALGQRDEQVRLRMHTGE